MGRYLTYRTIEGLSPTAFNASGQVVGFRIVPGAPSGTVIACLWDEGRVTELKGPDGNSFYPYAINSQGHIVGSSFDTRRAVLVRDGKFIDLGEGMAADINDAGCIVGAVGPHLTGPAAIWQYDQLVWTDTEPGVLVSVNVQGQAVGTHSFGEDGAAGLLVLEPGDVYELDTPEPLKFVHARGINDLGHIVGCGKNEPTDEPGEEDRGMRGLYWHGEGVEFLPPADHSDGTHPTCINNDGVIVGYCVNHDDSDDATLPYVPDPYWCFDGVAMSLNSGSYSHAKAISQDGHILISHGGRGEILCPNPNFEREFQEHMELIRSRGWEYSAKGRRMFFGKP